MKARADYFARQGSRGQGSSWKHQLRRRLEGDICYAWRVGCSDLDESGRDIDPDKEVVLT